MHIAVPDIAQLQPLPPASPAPLIEDGADPAFLQELSLAEAPAEPQPLAGPLVMPLPLPIPVILPMVAFPPIGGPGPDATPTAGSGIVTSLPAQSHDDMLAGAALPHSPAASGPTAAAQGSEPAAPDAAPALDGSARPVMASAHAPRLAATAPLIPLPETKSLPAAAQDAPAPAQMAWPDEARPVAAARPLTAQPHTPTAPPPATDLALPVKVDDPAGATARPSDRPLEPVAVQVEVTARFILPQPAESPGLPALAATPTALTEPRITGQTDAEPRPDMGHRPGLTQASPLTGPAPDPDGMQITHLPGNEGQRPPTGRLHPSVQENALRLRWEVPLPDSATTAPPQPIKLARLDSPMPATDSPPQQASPAIPRPAPSHEAPIPAQPARGTVTPGLASTSQPGLPLPSSPSALANPDPQPATPPAPVSAALPAPGDIPSSLPLHRTLATPAVTGLLPPLGLQSPHPLPDRLASQPTALPGPVLAVATQTTATRSPPAQLSTVGTHAPQAGPGRPMSPLPLPRETRAEPPSGPPPSTIGEPTAKAPPLPEPERPWSGLPGLAPAADPSHDMTSTQPLTVDQRPPDRHATADPQAPRMIEPAPHPDALAAPSRPHKTPPAPMGATPVAERPDPALVAPDTRPPVPAAKADAKDTPEPAPQPDPAALMTAVAPNAEAHALLPAVTERSAHLTLDVTPTSVSGPVARAAADAPVKSPAQQASAALAARPTDQPGRIEVTLAPETLGRLHFDMRPEGAGLAITLSAERPETLDLMRRHLPDLLVELKQAGVQAGTLSFGSWSEGRHAPPPAPPPPEPEFASQTAAPPPSPPHRQPSLARTQGMDMRL